MRVCGEEEVPRKEGERAGTLCCCYLDTHVRGGDTSPVSSSSADGSNTQAVIIPLAAETWLIKIPAVPLKSCSCPVSGWQQAAQEGENYSTL